MQPLSILSEIGCFDQGRVGSFRLLGGRLLDNDLLGMPKFIEVKRFNGCDFCRA